MLFDADLRGIVAFHRNNRALATIGLMTVDDPSSRGFVSVKDGKIVEFAQKSGSPTSNMVNAGLYVFEPGIFRFVPDGSSMLENDVFPKIAAKGLLFGFPLVGLCLDIGTPERYEKARKEWPY